MQKIIWLLNTMFLCVLLARMHGLWGQPWSQFIQPIGYGHIGLMDKAWQARPTVETFGSVPPCRNGPRSSMG